MPPSLACATRGISQIRRSLRVERPLPERISTLCTRMNSKTVVCPITVALTRVREVVPPVPERIVPFGALFVTVALTRHPVYHCGFNSERRLFAALVTCCGDVSFFYRSSFVSLLPPGAFGFFSVLSFLPTSWSS